jgi:putative endonuclease
MGWHLYIVRCNDQSLYAGITTDICRRIQEHNESPKGARYTKARRPVTLLISWPYENRSQATKAELAFKKLTTKKKRRIIENKSPPL